jgi:hypothetical protein
MFTEPIGLFNARLFSCFVLSPNFVFLCLCSLLLILVFSVAVVLWFQQIGVRLRLKGTCIVEIKNFISISDMGFIAHTDLHHYFCQSQRVSSHEFLWTGTVAESIAELTVLIFQVVSGICRVRNCCQILQHSPEYQHLPQHQHAKIVQKFMKF